MDRRDFLESTAATTAAAWTRLHWSALAATGAYATSTNADAPYEVLTPTQVKLLDAITSQIVPTDETPGAREAHVVRFIDHALGTIFKDRKDQVLGVLSAFETFTAHWRPDNAPFATLSSTDQISALQDFERMHPQQFRLLRQVTMVGMFSHPVHGGNFQKVGWQLIGFKDQYSWVPPFGYYDRV